MDALQADIDTLEQEKLELKERLSVLSKKTLLEGLSRQAGQGGLSAKKDYAILWVLGSVSACNYRFNFEIKKIIEKQNFVTYKLVSHRACNIQSSLLDG